MQFFCLGFFVRFNVLLRCINFLLVQFLWPVVQSPCRTQVHLVCLKFLVLALVLWNCKCFQGIFLWQHPVISDTNSPSPGCPRLCLPFNHCTPPSPPSSSHQRLKGLIIENLNTKKKDSFWTIQRKFCPDEIERRRSYITLPWQPNFWSSTKHGHANIAEKNEKIDMYDFPTHDCTQKQKRPSLMRKIANSRNLLPWQHDITLRRSIGPS